MKFTNDVRANVAHVEIDGDTYEFNMAKIQAQDARGIDERLYLATTMLSRLHFIKGKANSAYYRMKQALASQYWSIAAEKNFAALGLPADGKGQKPGSTHLTGWMQAQPDYQNLRELRDWTEDAITAMTTVWIPRLRDLSTQTSVGERETAGTKPPQSPEPLPFAPPPVQGQGAGVR